MSDSAHAQAMLRPVARPLSWHAVEALMTPLPPGERLWPGAAGPRPAPGGGGRPGAAAGAVPLDLLAPGATLAGLVQDACERGLDELGDEELVGVLRAARRLASWQAAVELTAVARLADRRHAAATAPGSPRTRDAISAELAAALTMTSRSAEAWQDLAEDLERIPAVLAALHDGQIDLARARVFADELAGLDAVTAAAIAAGWLHAAWSQTTGQLRAALRSLVLAADPEAPRKRAEAGQRHARVQAWREGSGNHALAGRELPASEVIAAEARISAIARALKAAGAAGDMDQLRAAVYTALLTGRDPRTLIPATEAAEAGDSAPGTGAAGTGAPGGSGAAAPSTAAPRTGAPGTGAPGVPDAAASGDGVPGAGTPTSPGACATGGLAGITGSVHLTMPASAYLGASDTPGEVAGFGPVDAATCRDLAARLAAGPGTRWCVSLVGLDGRAVAHACARRGPSPPAAPGHWPPGTAPPGHWPPGHWPPGHWPPGGGPPGGGGPLDDGFALWLRSLTLAWLESGECAHARQSPGYRPPESLRHLVKARQRTCCFPGCRRPARQCDDDHTIAYDVGGPTCECNLAPLCRRHHQVKQAPGWQLSQPRPGTLTWIAPHGRAYTTTPGTYPA